VADEVVDLSLVRTVGWSKQKIIGP
jgi:hypothetical protein